MAFVEIAIFAVVLAGSATTLFTLFSHCNGKQNKKLEIKEGQPLAADKDA